MRFTLFTLLVFAGPLAAANPVVTIETNMGTIEAELLEDKSPITVKNFLSYVDDKFYDGTIFHRVLSNFIIQGGGYEPNMTEKKTKDPIKNEAANGVPHTRGTLAMARKRDGDSAAAQFFINVVDNPTLEKAKSYDQIGWTVFGKVTKGLEVVDKIKAVKVGDKGALKHVPLDEVKIVSIKRAAAAATPVMEKAKEKEVEKPKDKPE